MELLNYSKSLRRVVDVDPYDYYNHLKMAVLRSERCQRNWDLSKEITPEQKDLLLFAATNAPTKQNNEYYSVVVTEDRGIIEAIHDETYFKPSGLYNVQERSNPQVLGQMLLVFVKNSITEEKNQEQFNALNGDASEKENQRIEYDRQQAVGVAAGHVSLMAALLGLESGCCKCMDDNAVKSILTINKHPILLMGIGYKDTSRNRRMHHLTNNKIGSFSKNIEVIKR